jgi:hypothetical protein
MSVKVKELIVALQKAKNQDAEVDIINEEGDTLAYSDEFMVDEDADGEFVHIVVLELGL